MIKKNYPSNTPASKAKWRKEKFWAFVLLGLNRMVNRDPQPPWGFEFLLKVNPQKWWWYQHYGFNSKDYGFQTQPEDHQQDYPEDHQQDYQHDHTGEDDDDQLSDAANAGDRPGTRDQHPSFTHERAWSDDFDFTSENEMHASNHVSSSSSSSSIYPPNASGGGCTPHFGWSPGFSYITREQSDTSATLSAVPSLPASLSPSQPTSPPADSSPRPVPLLPPLSDHRGFEDSSDNQQPLRFNFRKGFHHCPDREKEHEHDIMDCTCPVETRLWYRCDPTNTLPPFPPYH